MILIRPERARTSVLKKEEEGNTSPDILQTYAAGATKQSIDYAYWEVVKHRVSCPRADASLPIACRINEILLLRHL
jgi:hypothetical protein